MINRFGIAYLGVSCAVKALDRCALSLLTTLLFRAGTKNGKQSRSFSRFRGKNAFENANRKLENFVYRSVLFDDRHFCKKVQISKVEMKNGFFFLS